MSRAIDDAMTALCVAVGAEARREALVRLSVAALDALATSGEQTCRGRHDAFVAGLTAVVFAWEAETGIVVQAKL